MRRTALVTGAGGGIGLAIVERLVSDGVHVLATDVKDELRELLPGARYVPFDLLNDDPADLLGNVDAAGLDYLVNAAGVALFDRDGSVFEIDESVWQLTLGVNLHGLRRLTVAAVPYLRKGRGKSIVNVASIAGLRGMDSPLDAYQVSKAAVVSLTRSIALQLGPEGIRCNTVCPGAILTPMIAPLYTEDPERRARMEAADPASPPRQTR